MDDVEEQEEENCDLHSTDEEVFGEDGDLLGNAKADFPFWILCGSDDYQTLGWFNKVCDIELKSQDIKKVAADSQNTSPARFTRTILSSKISSWTLELC